MARYPIKRRFFVNGILYTPKDKFVDLDNPALVYRLQMAGQIGDEIKVTRKRGKKKDDSNTN